MSNLESVLSFVGGEHRARRESFGYWIREAFCRTFQFICRQLRVDGIGCGNGDTLECRFGKEILKCAECALGACVLYFGRDHDPSRRAPWRTSPNRTLVGCSV